MNRPFPITQGLRVASGKDGLHLCEDCERDLLRRIGAEVQAYRGVNARSLFGGDRQALRGQIGKDFLRPLPRPKKPEVDQRPG